MSRLLDIFKMTPKTDTTRLIEDEEKRKRSLLQTQNRSRGLQASVQQTPVAEPIDIFRMSPDRMMAPRERPPGLTPELKEMAMRKTTAVGKAVPTNAPMHGAPVFTEPRPSGYSKMSQKEINQWWYNVKQDPIMGEHYEGKPAIASLAKLGIMGLMGFGSMLTEKPFIAAMEGGARINKFMHEFTSAIRQQDPDPEKMKMLNRNIDIYSDATSVAQTLPGQPTAPTLTTMYKMFRDQSVVSAYEQPIATQLIDKYGEHPLIGMKIDDETREKLSNVSGLSTEMADVAAETLAFLIRMKVTAGLAAGTAPANVTHLLTRPNIFKAVGPMAGRIAADSALFVPGGAEERSSAFVRRLAYNLTPFVTNAVQIPMLGYRLHGAGAITFDTLLNMALTSPRYYEIIKQAEGNYDLDFARELLPELIMDIVMSLGTRGSQGTAAHNFRMSYARELEASSGVPRATTMEMFNRFDTIDADNQRLIRGLSQVGADRAYTEARETLGIEKNASIEDIERAYVEKLNEGALGKFIAGEDRSEFAKLSGSYRLLKFAHMATHNPNAVYDHPDRFTRINEKDTIDSVVQKYVTDDIVKLWEAGKIEEADKALLDSARKDAVDKFEAGQVDEATTIALMVAGAEMYPGVLRPVPVRDVGYVPAESITVGREDLSGVRMVSEEREGSEKMFLPWKPMVLKEESDPDRIKDISRTMRQLSDEYANNRTRPNIEHLTDMLLRYAPHNDRQALKNEIRTAMVLSRDKDINPLNILFRQWGYDGVKYEGKADWASKDLNYGNIRFTNDIYGRTFEIPEKEGYGDVYSDHRGSLDKYSSFPERVAEAERQIIGDKANPQKPTVLREATISEVRKIGADPAVRLVEELTKSYNAIYPDKTAGIYFVTPTSEKIANDFNAIIVGGNIYVNTRANNIPIHILKHEITHLLEKVDPRLYRALVQTVTKGLKPESVSKYREELIGGDERYENISIEMAARELVAEIVAESATYRQYWDRVGYEKVNTADVDRIMDQQLNDVYRVHEKYLKPEAIEGIIREVGDVFNQFYTVVRSETLRQRPDYEAMMADNEIHRMASMQRQWNKMTGYFHPLEKAVKTLPKKAPAMDIHNLLTKHVKEKELRYIGLTAYLADLPSSAMVTREEIVRFVDQNKLMLFEERLGHAGVKDLTEQLIKTDLELTKINTDLKTLLVDAVLDEHRGSGLQALHRAVTEDLDAVLKLYLPHKIYNADHLYTELSKHSSVSGATMMGFGRMQSAWDIARIEDDVDRATVQKRKDAFDTKLVELSEKRSIAWHKQRELQHKKSAAEASQFSRYVVQPSGNDYSEIAFVYGGRGDVAYDETRKALALGSADLALTNMMFIEREANITPEDRIKGRDHILEKMSQTIDPQRMLEYRESLDEVYSSALERSRFAGEHGFPPNTIAHVRFTTRRNHNGEKVLFVEEIQSDWGRHYRKAVEEGQQLTREEYFEYENLWKKGPVTELSQAENVRLRQLQNKLDSRRHHIEPPIKDFHELVLKRMVRYASDNGFDRIAWSRGFQVAKLYNLSEHVNDIIYYEKEVRRMEAMEKVDENGHYRAPTYDEAHKLLVDAREDYHLVNAEPRSEWKRWNFNQLIGVMTTLDKYMRFLEESLHDHNLPVSELGTMKDPLSFGTIMKTEVLHQLERNHADKEEFEMMPDKVVTYLGEYFRFAPYQIDRSRTITFRPIDSEYHRTQIIEEGKTLGDYIGNDLAKRLLENKMDPRDVEEFSKEDQNSDLYAVWRFTTAGVGTQETYRLSGDKLDMGAQWPYKLYDEMITNFAKKYAKQWGVKLDTTDVHGVMKEGFDKNIEDNMVPNYYMRHIGGYPEVQGKMDLVDKDYVLGKVWDAQYDYERKYGSDPESNPLMKKLGQRLNLSREEYDIITYEHGNQNTMFHELALEIGRIHRNIGMKNEHAEKLLGKDVELSFARDGISSEFTRELHRRMIVEQDSAYEAIRSTLNFRGMSIDETISKIDYIVTLIKTSIVDEFNRNNPEHGTAYDALRHLESIYKDFALKREQDGETLAKSIILRASYRSPAKKDSPNWYDYNHDSPGFNRALEILDMRIAVSDPNVRHNSIKVVPDMKSDYPIMQKNRSDIKNIPDDKNVGIHFGDLDPGKLGERKSDNLLTMSSSRHSGMYGTGTYFLSKDSTYAVLNSKYSSIKDKSIFAVDFDEYKLYKPAKSSDGMKLHDFLRMVNRYAYTGMLTGGRDDRNEAEDEREFIRDARSLFPEIRKELIGEELYKQELKPLLEELKSYVDNNFDRAYQEKLILDSPTTVFMKRLGYEGIDVRGISEVDNTGFGSVIYDLRADTFVRTDDPQLQRQKGPEPKRDYRRVQAVMGSMARKLGWSDDTRRAEAVKFAKDRYQMDITSTKDLDLQSLGAFVMNMGARAVADGKMTESQQKTLEKGIINIMSGRSHSSFAEHANKPFSDAPPQYKQKIEATYKLVNQLINDNKDRLGEFVASNDRRKLILDSARTGELHVGTDMIDSYNAIINKPFDKMTLGEAKVLTDMFKAYVHTNIHAPLLVRPDGTGTEKAFDVVKDTTDRIAKHHNFEKSLVGGQAKQFFKDLLYYNAITPEFMASLVVGSTMRGSDVLHDRNMTPFERYTYYDIDRAAHFKYDMLRQINDMISTLFHKPEVLKDSLLLNNNIEKTDRQHYDLESGKTIGLTAAERMDLYNHVKNAETLKDLIHPEGGIRIERQDNTYKHKKTQSFPLTMKDIETIIGKEDPATGEWIGGSLTADQRARADMMFEIENTMLRDMLNRTSMLLSGTEIATVENYWTRHRSSYDVFKAGGPKQISHKDFIPLTLEALSILHPRKMEVGKPVVLVDAYQSFLKYAEHATNYSAYALPYRNVQMVLDDPTFQRESDHYGLQKIREGIVRYVDSVATLNRHQAGGMEKYALDWVGRFQTAALGLSLWVPPKQLVSYALAATEIPAEFLLQAPLKQMSAEDRAELIKYSAQNGFLRIQRGAMSREMGEIGEMSYPLWFYTGKSMLRQQTTAAIRKFDQAAVTNIWKATKMWVQAERPELEGEALLRKTGELYDFVINRTQPTYLPHTRPELLRDSSYFNRMIGMFMTQRNKNLNMMFRSKFEFDNSEKTSEDYNRLVKNLSLVMILAPTMLLGIDELREKATGRDYNADAKSKWRRWFGYNVGNFFYVGHAYDAYELVIKDGNLWGPGASAYGPPNPAAEIFKNGLHAAVLATQAIEQARTKEEYATGPTKGDPKWEKTAYRAFESAMTLTSYLTGLPFRNLISNLKLAGKSISPEMQFMIDTLGSAPNVTKSYEKYWKYLENGDKKRAEWHMRILVEQLGRDFGNFESSFKSWEKKGMSNEVYKQAEKMYREIYGSTMTTTAPKGSDKYRVDPAGTYVPLDVKPPEGSDKYRVDPGGTQTTARPSKKEKKGVLDWLLTPPGQ